jgi:phage terminase small subunit
MAGQPGKSGGARPGAGRKPKPIEEKLTIVSDGKQTPLEFLLSVMNDNEVEDRLRLDAAKTAAQYVHPKVGEGGKKDERQQAAKRAGAGKFSAATPPRLVVNNE